MEVRPHRWCLHCNDLCSLYLYFCIIFFHILECHHENEIRPRDPIRCRECGYRIMYKKRTKRRILYCLYRYCSAFRVSLNFMHKSPQALVTTFFIFCAFAFLNIYSSGCVWCPLVHKSIASSNCRYLYLENVLWCTNSFWRKKKSEVSKLCRNGWHLNKVHSNDQSFVSLDTDVTDNKHVFTTTQKQTKNSLVWWQWTFTNIFHFLCICIYVYGMLRSRR